MTTIALPRPRNALLDRLRTIQIGIAARGAVGVGLATQRGGATGVNWSQWLTYAWIFKGATSQTASYTDVMSAQVLSVGVAPTWNVTDGLIFSGTQWLDTGINSAPNAGSGRYDRSIIVRISGASYPSVNHSILGVAYNAARQLSIGKYYVGTYFNSKNFQPGGYQLGASGVFAIDANGLAYKDGTYLGAALGSPGETTSRSIYIGAANASWGAAAYHFIGNVQFVGIRTSAWTSTELTDLTAAMAAL